MADIDEQDGRQQHRQPLILFHEGRHRYLTADGRLYRPRRAGHRRAAVAPQHGGQQQSEQDIGKGQDILRCTGDDAAQHQPHDGVGQPAAAAGKAVVGGRAAVLIHKGQHIGERQQRLQHGERGGGEQQDGCRAFGKDQPDREGRRGQCQHGADILDLDAGVSLDKAGHQRLPEHRQDIEPGEKDADHAVAQPLVQQIGRGKGHRCGVGREVKDHDKTELEIDGFIHRTSLCPLRAVFISSIGAASRCVTPFFFGGGRCARAASGGLRLFQGRPS